jgi:hypothetical protein
MYRFATVRVPAFCLFFFASHGALAQVGFKDSGLRFGALAFGDAYHIPSHHLDSGDGATGLVLRRAYLTADGGTGPWFGRARLEINQSGAFETYDFEADAKDLLVGFRSERHTITAGLQPTLTFDVIEAAWGKRYLMRTPPDLQGIPSRDTGLSIKGHLNESFSYRVMVGVGLDFGAESGDGNQAMLALNWRASEHWAIDLYYDQERRPGNNDVRTGQIFAHYTAGPLNAGAQYSFRDREDAQEGELFSTYAVYALNGQRSLIGRIDRILEPSIRGDNIAYIPFDPAAPATMFVAAYEHRLNDNLTVTPNAIFTRYDRDDQGARAKSDLYFRLTLFLDFE